MAAILTVPLCKERNRLNALYKVIHNMLFLFKKKRLGHVKMLYSVKQRRWKKKMNNIVSVLPLALKKWKEKI